VTTRKHTEHTLEWVTTAGNRYEIPIQLNEQLETEPFYIDAKFGAGHLELDEVAIGPDYEPDNDNPIVVNIRALLAAAGTLPGLPPAISDETPGVVLA